MEDKEKQITSESGGEKQPQQGLASGIGEESKVPVPNPIDAETELFVQREKVLEGEDTLWKNGIQVFFGGRNPLCQTSNEAGQHV